jgi:hypothetical protein
MTPAITFDIEQFRPLHIMPVQHALVGHPLLTLESLSELAKRLESRGSVRAHNDAALPSTSFNYAPDSHPISSSLNETLRNIERSKAWLALHNIQNDPLYRTLVDDVLDSIRPAIELKDPGMCHRAGWIFVTSPRAITPYHLDHEHNFILQVQGRKHIHVFDPLDRTIVTERALELFHMKLSRELVAYDASFEPKAYVMDAAPGMGAYMPSTAPHWVQNGDEVSITVSFTYYTRETMRLKSLYRANYALRRVGLSPEPVGRSRMRDEVKRALFLTEQKVLRSLDRRPPDPSLSDARYAPG